MKLKEFRKTNEFKLADCVLYIYEDGTEFDGTFSQLERKEIINIKPYKNDGLVYMEAIIK